MLSNGAGGSSWVAPNGRSQQNYFPLCSFTVNDLLIGPFLLSWKRIISWIVQIIFLRPGPPQKMISYEGQVSWIFEKYPRNFALPSSSGHTFIVGPQLQLESSAARASFLFIAFRRGSAPRLLHMMLLFKVLSIAHEKKLIEPEKCFFLGRIHSETRSSPITAHG